MSKAKIYDPEFAKRINLILENKFNGNSSEFARSIGVAVTSLNRWLIGEADPSRTNLIKTAEVSGVSIEWLATGKDNETSKNTTQNLTPLSIDDALEQLKIAIQHQCSNKGLQLSDDEIKLINDFRACNNSSKQAIALMAQNGAELASSYTDAKDGAKDNVA